MYKGVCSLVLDFQLSASCHSFAGRSRNRLLFAVRFLSRLSGLADIDSAFEERAIFNGDARCNYVAGERAVAADVHTVAGSQVAAHLAENNDLTSINVGGNNPVASNCHAIAGQVDGTFDAAIDVQGLGSGYFALNDERLPDGSLIRCAGRDGTRSTGGRFRYRGSARR